MFRIFSYLACFAAAVWAIRFGREISFQPDTGNICFFFYGSAISIVMNLSIALYKDLLKWRMRRAEEIDVDDFAE